MAAGGTAARQESEAKAAAYWAPDVGWVGWMIAARRRNGDGALRSARQTIDDESKHGVVPP